MCKAWKDDLKSMILPSGKDHYRIISLSSLPVSTLFHLSDEPLVTACLLG